VICSRIDGNVDIVEHKKTGLLFEPRSDAALYEQLEFALANRDLIRQYAGNLRLKVERYFDQPVVHDQIRRKYLELLAESQS
ncbi:MAG: glycosyltransferase, partial [Ferruginibacter sp.]|nr:glycosyltransferase [Ferruginibacter sp.]